MLLSFICKCLDTQQRLWERELGNGNVTEQRRIASTLNSGFNERHLHHNLKFAFHYPQRIGCFVSCGSVCYTYLLSRWTKCCKWTNQNNQRLVENGLRPFNFETFQLETCNTYFNLEIIPTHLTTTLSEQKPGNILSHSLWNFKPTS